MFSALGMLWLRITFEHFETAVSMAGSIPLTSLSLGKGLMGKMP
jgi:hypothetical protein